jgi:hypothetical protein
MLLDGLGRVFIGSMFGDRLVWVVGHVDVENSAQPTQLLETESRCPTNMTAKS